jgi:hypothetical protein
MRTQGDLMAFCAEHHLNPYMGKGRVWDHQGRVIAKNKWWCKLVADEARVEAYSLGMGSTWLEALTAAVADFERHGVRVARA